MNEHVRIGMPEKSLAVWNVHPAKNELSSRGQRMHVIAIADSHAYTS
jgi:hypothetical protein